MAKRRKKRKREGHATGVNRPPKMCYSRDYTFLFHELDKKYFGGRLRNIEVYHGQLAPRHKHEFRYAVTGISVCGRPMYIVLNEKLRAIGQDVSEMTLLHEMIHVKYPKDKDNHGKVFKKERRRLILAGAFDELI